MKSFTLQEKQTVVLKGSRKVLCLSGTIWITWPGSPDKIVKAAEEFILSPVKGKIIVQNIGPGPARMNI